MSNTKEPWLVQKPHAGKKGFEIADSTGINQVCQDLTEENARRIAACVNFCTGVSTENLENNNPLLVLLDDYNAAKRQLNAISAGTAKKEM